MNPYRTPVIQEMILSNKPPRLRTFRRKFLILLYGTFKERKPDKCHHCGKRSRAVGSSIRWLHLNYYDCGCRRHPEGITVHAS